MRKLCHCQLQAIAAEAMGRLLAVRTPAWANHVEGLLAYTAAVAGNDQNAKTVATQNLDGFAERLALLQRHRQQRPCRRSAGQGDHRP